MDIEITGTRSITHYTISGNDVITWTCTVSGGGGGTVGGGGGGGSGGGGGGGVSIPNDPYDDGSGWGGDIGTTSPTQTARIINNLPPCLNQSYVSLLGAIALYASQLSATGSPSSFLPISYFTGPTHDWELHKGPLPPDTYGQTHIDYPTNTMITVLDDQKLRNATDLRVMVLLLHESVHAYLVAYFENDPTKFGLSYPELVYALRQQIAPFQNNTQHNLMVTDFKNEIGQILYTYCTQLGYNVSLQYCQDLAWSGLGGTDAFLALSPGEQTRIVNALTAEETGLNAKGLQPSGC